MLALTACKGTVYETFVLVNHFDNSELHSWQAWQTGNINRNLIQNTDLTYGEELFCHSGQTEVEESFSAKRHTQMESLSSAVCSFKTVQDWKGAVFMGHAVATCSLYLGILKSDWIFGVKFVSGYFMFSSQYVL